MRKEVIIILIILLSIYNEAYCQNDSTKRLAIIVDFRMNKISANNQKFDKWTDDHQYQRRNSLIGFSPAIWCILKKSDFGIQQIVSHPYLISSVFYGRNMIRAKNFNSFLNLDIGGFFAENHDILPPNYRVINGQKMELEYRAGYLGISSKNIFLKSVYDWLSLDLGFDINIGYMPLDGKWRYGYFIPINNVSATFLGNYVNSLPALSKFCFSATIFIGINANSFLKHKNKG
jgi:hypothetical protein